MNIIHEIKTQYNEKLYCVFIYTFCINFTTNFSDPTFNGWIPMTTLNINVSCFHDLGSSSDIINCV